MALERADRGSQVRAYDALIIDFIGLLENYGMATPKLTFDALASVYPYNEFYDAFGAILRSAEQSLRYKGLLDRFERVTDRKWQEEHHRIGYRLFTSKTDRSRFAFMGLWCGPEPIIDGVPDLYFFLELGRESDACERLDDQGGQIAAAIAELNALGDMKKWNYAPGGYETIRCRMSMLELVRAPDAAKAAEEFFAECLVDLEKYQMMSMYFRAIDV